MIKVGRPKAAPENVTTNIRVYKKTHKRLQDFAREYDMPLVTLVDRLSLKLKTEKYTIWTE